MYSIIFKYQAQMDALNLACPPEDYLSSNIIAYRWVFENMEDENNFIPQYFKVPKYANSTDDSKCQSLGLSFFDSKKNAKDRFNFLKKRMGKNAYKRLGRNLAEGNLSENDGVNSSINDQGHFTHHPSEEENYNKSFVIIAKL